jgi:hypothetical protein
MAQSGENKHQLWGSLHLTYPSRFHTTHTSSDDDTRVFLALPRPMSIYAQLPVTAVIEIDSLPLRVACEKWCPRSVSAHW